MFKIDLGKARNNFKAKNTCSNCKGIYKHVMLCDTCPIALQRHETKNFITDLTDYSDIPF